MQMLKAIRNFWTASPAAATFSRATPAAAPAPIY